jgi:hypothetical protein
VLYDHFRKAANIKGKKTVQFKSSVKDVKWRLEDGKYQNCQFDTLFTRLSLNVSQRVYYSEC